MPPSLFVAGISLPVAGAWLYWLAGRRGGGWPRLVVAYYGLVLAGVTAMAAGTRGGGRWPVLAAAFIGLMSAGTVGGLGLAIAAAATFGTDGTARRRSRHGRCLRCGYDLTGNASGVCPECGTTVAR